MSSVDLAGILVEQLHDLLPDDRYLPIWNEHSGPRPLSEIARVETLFARADPTERAVALSVYQSLIDLHRSIVGRVAHEEYQSAALIAHYLTNLRWFSQAIEAADEGLVRPAFHWASFSKHEEARIGADFAVIAVPRQQSWADEKVNIGLFQAKLRNKRGSAKISHITGKGKREGAIKRFETALRATLFSSPLPKPYLQIHALAHAQQVLNELRPDPSEPAGNFCFYCLFSAKRDDEIQKLPMSMELSFILKLLRSGVSVKKRCNPKKGMSVGWRIVDLYARGQDKDSIEIGKLKQVLEHLLSVFPRLDIAVLSPNERSVQPVLDVLRQTNATISPNLSKFDPAPDRPGPTPPALG